MKKVFKNVLVPVDFSSPSIAAVKFAVEFTRRFGGIVHLANVQLFSYTSFSPFSIMALPPLLGVEAKRRDAERALAKLARRLAVSGTCRVGVGTSAFVALCEIARKIKADLIVTPTRGQGGVKHLLLGSTAERLVQHSPCPILVVRSRTAKGHGVRKILVPVDFSACAFNGLRYAIRFAKKCGAEILVFYAIDSGGDRSIEEYKARALSILDEQSLADANRDIALFTGAASFDGVPYEAAVRIGGDPAQSIAAFAKEQAADLIVTSTHGRTGLAHVRIGSIAERIVRQAPCPALVVPSHSERRTVRSQKSTRPRTTLVTGPHRVKRISTVR